MLLMIGYLTTPVASTGVSLSEFWAWVRYLAALSSQLDMASQIALQTWMRIKKQY